MYIYHKIMAKLSIKHTFFKFKFYKFIKIRFRENIFATGTDSCRSQMLSKERLTCKVRTTGIFLQLRISSSEKLDGIQTNTSIDWLCTCVSTYFSEWTLFELLTDMNYRNKTYLFCVQAFTIELITNIVLTHVYY